MAQLMEYADYLSKEIGPRPAGTEEEQQAALYITEQLQKDSGFSAQIEEFTCSSNLEGISAIPGIIVIVVAILGMIFPVLAIPAFILAAASAALYTLEAFGHPIVTRALARGASQNVVAKYQPASDSDKTAHGRSRKIVLVARYDSGKVTPGLVNTVESIKLPLPIGLICVGGIVLAAILLLIHVFVNTGVPGIVVNILTIITLIVCAYPVLRAVLYRTAPYNEGANNNATGTAALLEVARRISRGSVSEADLAEQAAADGVRIHGEEAARNSGLVPEGAQIRYEAEQLVPPSEIGSYDENERLLAAKAAIAALTGQPVERRSSGSVASKLVNSRASVDASSAESAASHVDEAEDGRRAAPEEPAYVANSANAPVAEPADAPIASPAVSAEPVVQQTATSAPAPVVEAMPAPSAEAEGYKNAPSWFVSAQQNAKKPLGDTGPIQRSRYAEAIEAAEREAAERERERLDQERQQREEALRAREAATRAAIASAPPVAEAQDEQAAQPAEPASERQPEDAPATPVFVPYDQAIAAPREQGGDEGAPADDEFAASLGSTTAFVPVSMSAPLVDSADDADTSPMPVAETQQSRLAGLPSIARLGEDAAPAIRQDEPAAAPETVNPSRSGMFRRLRTDVPSLSGVIRAQAAGEDVSQIPAVQQLEPLSDDSAAPAPVVVPEVVFDAPETVPAELAPNRSSNPAPEYEAVDYDMTPSDLGVFGDDLGGYDEDDYDDQVALEVPKSRAGGLLNRFRRKGKGRESLEETPQEWLDIDDDFDARTVGRERGGWESFRDDVPDDFEGNASHRRWEGGSYSRVRLGHVDMRSGADSDVSTVDEIPADEAGRQIADEIEQIYHFRNPLYNTEVWFVALGSEGFAHDGTKAFLAEHADDLRGSMIIEIESLGAGELCVATSEGSIRPMAASSRVKRYTRSATAATGIAPGSVDLTGSDSAASILQAAGYQTIHLLGVEDGRPALKGSADDILENVDDLLLDDNVNFLMELLKK